MDLFTTNRTRVRRFTHQDQESFFRINGDPKVMAFIRPAKSREDCEAFLLENILFYREGSLLGRYAVEEKANGRFLGTFSFLYLSGEADYHIGYALLPEFWGQGYATELVQEGIRYFFDHTQHLQLFAITRTNHLLSQKVLERSGFGYQGLKEENGEQLALFYIERSAAASAE
jgi:ribosomal-protein-alanine N-acetyltransferase